MITKDKIERICFDEILELWKGLPTSFPEFLVEVEEAKKRRNEAIIQEMAGQWRKRIKAFPTKQEEQKNWKQEMDKLIGEFLAKEQLLGIKDHMSQETFEAFQAETKRFVRKTRSFDSKLTMENIWQALRNYFIYAVIADLQGQKQECKETAFSYSLLYPYTDNYIDEKRHTRQQKEAYNNMICDVLKEKTVMPEKGIAEKTCQLLEILLNTYEGEKRKEAQNLLLLMLEAQNNSIRQQMGKQELTPLEILRISVYKGSISVLIDYFFTVSEMKKEEIEFYLKFGFLLQLADDLQDVKEDQESGSKTIMVMYAKKGGLEKVVNRLLHYTQTIFEEFTPVNDSLKSFMLGHCYSMIIAAAMANREYFSKEYMKQLERFFMVHMEYLEKQKKIEKGKKNSERVKEYSFEILDLMVG